MFSAGRLALTSVIVGTVAISCGGPSVRTMLNEEVIVQGQSLMQTETASFNDTDPAQEAFTITGTEQTLNFSSTIVPAQQGFQQVAQFGQHWEFSHTQLEGDEPITKADILLVVDNSASMSEEQTKLIQNFSTFLTKIDSIDWRVAVVNSNGASYGTLHQNTFISKGQLPPAQQQAAFNSLIATGNTGPSTERPIVNAIGVWKNNPNGFNRADAHTIVIFVSDEDTCSRGMPEILESEDWNLGGPYTGPSRPTPNPTNYCRRDWDSATAFMEVGQEIKGDKFKAYGIIFVPGTNPPAIGCGAECFRANELHSVVTQTGGFSRSIWLPDYSQVLEDIGGDINSGLAKRFTIGNIAPNAGSIIVTVDGQTIASNLFTVEGNELVFNGSYVPPSLSSVHIEYWTGQVPLQELTLNSAPIVASIRARINNVLTSAYTYNTTTRVLRFNTPPGAGLPVTVTYDIAPAVVTTYSLGTHVPATNSLTVKVDDVALTANQYSVNQSIVTINTYPGPYAQIQIKFIPRTTLPATFPISHTPSSAVTVLVNGQPSSVVTYNAALNRLDVNRSLAIVGQAVSAAYSWRARDTRVFPITGQVMPNTLSVKLNGNDITTFTFANNQVTFTQQLVPASGNLSFTYVKNDALPSEFKLSPDVSRVIQVLLDEDVVDSWTYNRETRMLAFTQAPRALAKIKVFYEK